MILLHFLININLLLIRVFISISYQILISVKVHTYFMYIMTLHSVYILIII